MSFENKATAKIFFKDSYYNLIPFKNCLSDSYTSMDKKLLSQMMWFCHKGDISLQEMSHPKTIPECSLCALRKVNSSIVVLKKIIF